MLELIRLNVSKNSIYQLMPVGSIKELVVFSNVNYLQVHGTAMGTRMEPSYANLFMGKLEPELLRTQDKIPRVWWRYIDDIFAVWTHGEPALRACMQNLN